MPEFIELLQFLAKLGFTVFIILLTFKFVFTPRLEGKIKIHHAQLPASSESKNLDEFEIVEEPRNIFMITKLVDSAILVSIDLLIINYMWLNSIV
ncbi:MAG: hypothetical protein JKY33_01885 [Bacteroidia bacterium]|nr:hypothetical protein [Bacteroidia bacterium]